jgi:hypothetical protein
MYNKSVKQHVFGISLQWVRAGMVLLLLRPSCSSVHRAAGRFVLLCNVFGLLVTQ